MIGNRSDFPDFITKKREVRFKEIDGLPKEMREMVHKWGYTIVKNCMNVGIRKPKHIDHIVTVILDETRAPNGQSYSSQGPRQNHGGPNDR